MKVSDYIAQYVASLGVRDVFLISGGGMMHLLDSFGATEGLRLICNLNEQATAICAEGYGQYTNDLGVCLLTTGPGGTNAVTGVAAAYFDSTPMLVISGQCKTADFAKRRGVRQFGAQETDVVSIVTPITNYAVTVEEPTEIRYHLERAVYLAKEGRRGPVWIDVPLDVQAAVIRPESLRGFVPEPMPAASGGQAKDVLALLAAAKRPVVLLGNGAVSGRAKQLSRTLVEKLAVPVLTTWKAKDFLPHAHPLYFGMPGAPAYRYSNYVLQNADFLLIVGSRVSPSVCVYDEENFAPRATKVIVDIDEQEIEKLNMPFALRIVADAADFAEHMLAALPGKATEERAPWLSFCRAMQEKYPLQRERQAYDTKGLADGYVVADCISRHSRADDVFAGSSSGRTCGISHLAFFLKEGQRFISSMGLGSMGCTIPYAIACALASHRRVIAFEGDGSLQHNMQELQLIRTYRLPVKLFVLSNGGYASIYMMQKHNFGERYVATDPKSGLAFPALADVANTFGLRYLAISSDAEAEEIVAEALRDDEPVLCEVVGSIYFDEIPKSMTIAHPDGTFSSSKLENLYPFLPPEEVLDNMPDWD